MHQLVFIVEFLWAKVNNRVFLKLEISYADYLSYFVRELRLMKYMYGMTNPGKLFTDKLADWLINKTSFTKYQKSRCLYIIGIHQTEQLFQILC